MKKLLILFLVFVLLGCGFDILAQEASKKQAAAGQKEEKEKPLSGEAVKILMDKIEVLGRIEKPQAVFIVPGNDPRVDDIQIDRSFFSEIFRPIDKDTFKKSPVRTKGFIPW